MFVQCILDFILIFLMRTDWNSLPAFLAYACYIDFQLENYEKFPINRSMHKREDERAFSFMTCLFVQGKKLAKLPMYSPCVLAYSVHKATHPMANTGKR